MQRPAAIGQIVEQPQSPPMNETNELHTSNSQTTAHAADGRQINTANRVVALLMPDPLSG